MTQSQAGKRVGAAKRVGGVALMLAGVALIGFGAHHVTVNGNCSSTGYLPTGPAPKCSGSEALYILSLFFLGPALAVIGWVIARVWGTLWPLVCVSLGVGLVTIRLDKTAATGAKAFGLVAGVCMFALAVLSVVITVRKRLGRAAPVSLADLGVASGPMTSVVSDAAPAVSDAAPAMKSPAFDPPPHDAQQAAGGPRPDPLDQIAKLAQLRDSGALTDEEFQRQKAKLLAQM